jgi:hypothetical protein
MSSASYDSALEAIVIDDRADVASLADPRRTTGA